MRRGARFRAAAEAALLLAFLPAFANGADETPAVRPYRPTVSNPADLPVPGWLELEFGALREASADERRESLPYLLKYAFDANWGVLAGGDALVRDVERVGQTRTGFGDTSILAKRRLALTDATACALEFGLRVPTAKSGLGSSGTDYVANGIVSTDFGRVHLDLNAGPTRIGRPEEGTGRAERAWSAALSGALGPRWTLAGEVSGTQRRATPTRSQFLFALAYAASPRAVFDFGFARGLSVDRERTLFAGVTVLLGKLERSSPSE